ncbi:MAG: PAS domain S-box protein [Pseudomonadota bacterium]
MKHNSAYTNKAVALLLYLFALVFFLLSSSFSPSSHVSASEVKIAVLSFHSKQETFKKWQPTADYLSQSINNYHFKIIPMFYKELEQAVQLNSFDFILTNSSHHVALKVKYQLIRLATIAKLKSTSSSLSKKVLIALLKLKADDRATQLGNYKGWSTQLDYRPVRLMIEKLRVGPFKVAERFNLWDVAYKYRSLIAIVGLLFLVLIGLFIIRILKLNNSLQHAKQSLENIESRLSDFQKIAHIGRWEWDVINNKIIGTYETYQIFGMQQLKYGISYESFFKKVHPDDKKFIKKIVKSMKQIDAKNDPVIIEHRVILPDGDIKIVLQQGEMKFDTNGKPIKMIGTIQDITQQSRMEQIIRTSELRYKHLAEQTQADYFIYSYDTNGIFQYVSPSVETILGYKPDEFLTHHSSYFTTNNINKQAKKFSRLSSKGEKQAPYEIELNTMKGNVCRIEVSEVPVFDKAGNVFAVEGIAHNISDRIKAEKQLADKERLLRQMFENNTAVKLVIDPSNGKIINANPAACQFYGYSLERITSMNISSINTLPPEQIKSEIEQAVSEKKHSFQFKHRIASGEIRDVEVHVGNIIIDNKKYLHTIVFDVTQRNKYAYELKRQQAHLKEIIWATNVGTWEWDIPTGETIFNQRWAEMIGYNLDEISPVSIESWNNFVHKEDQEESNKLLKKIFNKELDYYEHEIRMLHKDGHWVNILTRGKIVKWAKDGSPIRMSGTHSDISKRKQAENKITYMAQHDLLTNLPNRRLFEELSNLELHTAKRNKGGLAILFIDIDHFKLVNDTLGHAVGDEVLQKIATRLQALVRKSDIVSRFGGDEFVILLSSQGSSDGAQKIAQAIVNSISSPFQIEGQLASVGASIGIAIYPANGNSVDALIQVADKSMYRAKSEGRNTWKMAEN